MTENYEHYITRNIRAFYKRRLFSPICYLLLLLILWFIFPLGEMASPHQLSSSESLKKAHASGKEYVSVTLENLTFTGYTTTRFGSTNGYWYYGTNENDCYIVLLTPFTCVEGLPTIEKVHVNCRIVESRESYSTLLSYLAEDLEWTASGLANQLPDCYYSESDCNPLTNFLLLFFYFGSLAYTIISLARYITFIYFPFLAPACQNLVDPAIFAGVPAM